MRRFEIQRPEDLATTGEGVQFSDDSAIVRHLRPFGSWEIIPGGAEAIEIQYPGHLVWLDPAPICVPQPEEETGRHAQPVDFTEVQAVEHLKQEVWQGAPLPPVEGPPPPDALFAYNVNQGGLMRCCLETLDSYMLVRRDEGHTADGEDGDVVACEFCPGSMIRNEGAWGGIPR